MHIYETSLCDVCVSYLERKERYLIHRLNEKCKICIFMHPAR